MLTYSTLKIKSKHSMRTIQIEMNIDSLLKQFPGNQKSLYDNFKSREPLSALSLGCNVPMDLFVLYQHFDFKVLQGVDLNTEIQIIEEYLKRHCYGAKEESGYKNFLKNNMLNASKFYSFYDRCFNSGSKSLNEREFEEIFLKNFKFVDVNIYLEKEVKKFDIILAINIFHFEGIKIEQNINSIKRALKPNSLALIRVESISKNPSFSYPEFKKIIETTFEGQGQIYECYDEITGKWKSSVYSNLPLI